MTALITFHDRAFARLDAAVSEIVLPTAARLVFAGVLLFYFWASAVTKLGDGLLGWIRLDTGAYIQMFPRAFEAAGYDPSALPISLKLIALAGTWAEFILPLMIVIGLFTRLAALGMIGFVVVMSATDIAGHGVDAATIGAWFDRASGAPIADQRAFWLFLLLFLALRGGGPLSADRFLGIGHSPRDPA
ncbi:DoxX family membrane protein [Rhodovulum sp. 12E13]|uniref:DoxX family membrane protein n=1 Tax=Rhodovulum sp. 12E13 TaxID=2203891 RepID=UPI000E120E58|nr:DoxX family membrane protein [Rhodovulum sp. 12E13]RDC71066.1 DoxX family membrane protein [Rhodovulum sp. 12E13]